MSRTPAQVHAAIAGNHLPDGFAWDHALAFNTMRSFWPLARFSSAFEVAAEARLLEATPATAELMLRAYERVLGAGHLPGRLGDAYLCRAAASGERAGPHLRHRLRA